MTSTAAPPAPGTRQPGDFHISRYHVDLSARTVRHERVRCEDLEDVLGGAARGYKLLASRQVDDAYDPKATLILNLGILSGSAFMTGLRTFFHAYSPLKTGASGRPGVMWTAGSGKFGTKLRHMGIEEVFFTGRCDRPTLLHLRPGPSPDAPASFEFKDAEDLSGKKINAKIQWLKGVYTDAHFAVIGPAGENYEACRFAAIGLSTENQLKSGDPKTRFCGRGGIGGVMGSKNLLAIVADVKDPPPSGQPAFLKDVNMEVARGKGSARFRDKKKDGGGGTWANAEALNPIHAMPEYNFVPTGTDCSNHLYRDTVEAVGKWVVKDEACYRCGIRCHKNVYDNDGGKPGRFRAKLDFEPLNLLSSNIGVFDVDEMCDLVEMVDEMGMDSISCGVTLSYAMEYNMRHQADGKKVAGGLSYGDAKATMAAVVAMGEGRLPQLGQGSRRLALETGETGYAMHCKGVEFPAYLPQTNPGYPFALAGGHMSMRTYLLCVYEKETGMDYWVNAITERGPLIMRDDLLGVCKFANLDNAAMCNVLRELTGLDIDEKRLVDCVMRTYLRGYRNERAMGFTDADYDMPSEVHNEYPQIELPYFNTPTFFAELKGKVIAKFEAMASDLLDTQGGGDDDDISKTIAISVPRGKAAAPPAPAARPAAPAAPGPPAPAAPKPPAPAAAQRPPAPAAPRPAAAAAGAPKPPSPAAPAAARPAKPSSTSWRQPTFEVGGTIVAPVQGAGDAVPVACEYLEEAKIAYMEATLHNVGDTPTGAIVDAYLFCQPGGPFPVDKEKRRQLPHTNARAADVHDGASLQHKLDLDSPVLLPGSFTPLRLWLECAPGGRSIPTDRDWRFRLRICTETESLDYPFSLRVG